jgi:uncharacterized membrane protein
VMHDSIAHTLNIGVHVVFGTAALTLGILQLVAAKGGPRHRLVGRLFMRAAWLVVLTATTGLTLFRFGAFLAVLTLLVAYWLYSGVRALRIRHTGPTMQDAAASCFGLLSVVIFLYYLPSVRYPWVPSIIYSTLATLTAVALYDLTRFAFPKRWFESLWLYEHVVKMIGAHGAIVSAFAGTVLPFWQPFSQVIAPVVWTALQLGFVVHIARRARREASPQWTRRIA